MIKENKKLLVQKWIKKYCELKIKIDIFVDMFKYSEKQRNV